MKKVRFVLTVIAVSIGLFMHGQITENFETTPLTGWTFYQTAFDDPGFAQTSTQAHGGSYSFYHSDDDISTTSSSWMVSPSYTCGTNDELVFWYYQDYSVNWYVYAGVWISTTSNDPIANPTAFTELMEFGSGSSEDFWSEVKINLAAYNTQTVYIAFKYTGDYSHIVYIDDVSLDAVPLCPSPYPLTSTNITATSADLSWTETGTATSWQVEYGTSGFTQGTGTSTFVNTNPTTTISNLMSDSDYDFYVRSICGVGDTSTWSLGTFHTSCAAYTAPYSHNFNNGPSSSIQNCWTDIENVTQSLSFLSINTIQNVSPPSCLLLSNFDTSGDLIAVSPMFSDFDANKRIKFQVFDNNNSSDLIIGTMSDPTDATTFTPWDTLTAAAMPNYTWQEYTIYFTGYVGTDNYIAFKHGMNSTGYIYIDDFLYDNIPSCIEPSNLLASNITLTSADVSWTEMGSATSWQVEYGTAGFVLGMGQDTIVNMNPTTLSGLDMNNEYEFYVRAICGAGDTSLWMGPYLFTGYCIPTPTSVDGNGIINVSMGSLNNTTGAEVGNYGNYTDQIVTAGQGVVLNIDITYATGYSYDTWVWVDWNNDLDFDDSNEAYFLGTSTSANPTVLSSSIAIPSTASLGNHRLRIGGADSGLGTTPPADYCYDGSYASFEDYTLNITTPPACSQPTALMATNVSTTSAVLSWTEIGSASSWFVEYGAAGFVLGTGTSQVVTTDSLAVSGLSPMTNYDFYVQSICGAGDSSVIVGPYSFTTACTVLNTLPFLETFESTSASLSCWTNVSNIGNWDWMISNNGGSNINGTAMAFFDDDAAGDNNDNNATLYSPIFDLTAFASVELSYEYNFRDYNPGNSLTVDVWDGSVWQTVQTVNTDDCGAWGCTPIPSILIDVTSYINAAFQVRFTYDDGVGAGWAYYAGIDNFEITGVQSPLLSSTTVLANVSCNGGNDGAAMVTATGGVSPYIYSWNNGMTNDTINNLTAGTYDVVITDANGDTTMSSVNITEPMQLSLSTTSVADTNTTGIGMASVIVAGGTTPYTYSWNNGGMSDTLSNVLAGTYTVTVTDANGCTMVDSVVVSNYVGTNALDYITNLQISPNPTNGFVTIQFELSNYADVNVRIYDLTGQIVQDLGHHNTTSKAFLIDLSGYASGMYMVQFIIEGNVITRKLILNK